MEVSGRIIPALEVHGAAQGKEIIDVVCPLRIGLPLAKCTQIGVRVHPAQVRQPAMTFIVEVLVGVSMDETKFRNDFIF
ncbi:hypothetical protein NT2_14_00400 [Caenibius tardaugens NBRC 16725]|uniref:Uncharacterized protein n=1 Tax=Caenibius tardaugens NBRC 16725 TaxID=1219035 RepID=U2YBW8_9SPHN|nr:hypothetical protein [Caenibius tardaugens]AZI35355.1 hypothetical protein EGO55_04745 [Caenibius tardaugens NBRC 16725]GAD51036.1 hypothetical protein NT2_14_00400 [Caenibius tardaugens NBRC 16725]